jgi:hypothetical protein
VVPGHGASGHRHHGRGCGCGFEFLHDSTPTFQGLPPAIQARADQLVCAMLNSPAGL